MKQGQKKQGQKEKEEKKKKKNLSTTLAPWLRAHSFISLNTPSTARCWHCATTPRSRGMVIRLAQHAVGKTGLVILMFVK